MNIKRPFWIAYKVYVLTVFFVTLIPFYPIFVYLLAKESRWKRCFVWQVRWGKVVLFFAGIKLKIEGKENLPKAPYVIISNHASYIDTFLMYGIIPEFFVFMGMAELAKFPMFGRFFTSGQNIAVNRSSRMESVKAFKIAGERLAKGFPVALFPEGGIKEQVPELANFKNGAFKMAMIQGVPIVPILMFDTHLILESNDLFKTIGRPGIARVKILKPIETIDLKQEDLIPLREQIRNTMKVELDSYYAN
jgi:1-acyl-sn-glycerol-3-phosphate acyltransferase